MLTNRQKNIIFHLLGHHEPVLIEDLAKEFSVASRTIKSDIKVIKSWVKDYDAEVMSRPNKGIWLKVANESEKLYFHQQLMMIPVNEEMYGVESRIERIIVILALHPFSYMTADRLAESLSVSKKTIYSDIKKVHTYLEKHQLTLVTTTGKGYTLEGSEGAIRHVAEYILVEKLAETNVTAENNLMQIKNYLRHLSKELNDITQIIDDSIQLLNRRLKMENLLTNRLLSMLIRLVISVSRNGKEYQTVFHWKEIELDSNDASYMYSLMEAVYHTIHLNNLKNEFIYVYHSTSFDQEKGNIIEIANNIIQFVSDKMSIAFFEDTSLQVNLMAHISNKFTEESLDLFKKNPFLDEIKKEHQYLYEPVRLACEKYIERSQTISNELISSFITLHFLVSLKTNFAENKSIKALYVCATGRGVARIIKYRVEREIPQLKVVHYCGLDEVDQMIEQSNYDLVISVSPMDLDIPTVWVQPVPSNDNIQEIKNIVEGIVGINALSLSETKRTTPKQFGEHSSAEEVSQEVILKSMEIYHSLKEVFNKRINPALEEAFLMHVFLMVHRVTFSQEYDYLMDKFEPPTSDYKLVDDIFKQHQFQTSIDEKKAILFYIEKENDHG